MPPPDNITESFNRLINGAGLLSGQETIFNLVPIKIEILEMEDVLFHHNSAVMMPDRPQGQSSTQGGGAQANQERINGLQVIAVVFREFEIDSRKRLLIAAHTDTSGDPLYNFTLSDLRAQGVLYLLIGEPELWADISFEKQKIEDYQQIMQYFAVSKSWDCDPGKLDNTWGPKTKRAVENFFSLYNTKYAPANKRPLLPPDLAGRVVKDSKKRWPVEAWQAVFYLYNDVICSTLKLTPAELEGKRTSLLQFADPISLYVACGESFPIDQVDKSNYKSQSNRRVEFLFFDQDEVPIILCPSPRSTVHKPEECPIWNRRSYFPVYIDPKDLTIVPYHLKFAYFNRIRNEWRDVPDGVTIRAFEDGNQEVQLQKSFSGGIYTLKIQDNPARKELNFTFETVNQYIYTADASTDPVLTTMTPNQIDALTPVERMKYYDLPTQWSSKNYWTRHSGSMDKGDRFEVVMKSVKGIKPYGGNLTTANEPLVFSLDDIVLVDQARNQTLSDKDQNDAAKPLSADSRHTLFHIDHDTMEDIDGVQKNMRRLKIYKQDANECSFTTGALPQNLITDVPGHTRIVYFCNGFYDVYTKRSGFTDMGFDFAKGHVLGARLAVLEDPLLQAKQSVNEGTASDRTNTYVLDNCGNYDMHYFDRCDELDGKMLGYLFIHWSCRFSLNNVTETDPNTGNPVVTINPGTANDVINHRKEGMKNAMERLNKNYLAEKSSGDCDIVIRINIFTEAKNDTRGGQHKAMVNIVQDFAISGADSGAWMRPNESQLRCRDYEDDPQYFDNNDPMNSFKDTDGNTYCVLTNHHEFGHATGNWDDYLYDFEDGTNAWGGLPRYDQPFTAEGGPYTCDKISRMNSNRTPRLRNYWKYVCWLHDTSKAGGILNPFFRNTKFKLTFRATGFVHNFELADSYKKVAFPSKKESNYEMYPDIRADMLLYKLGDDELAHLLKAGTVFNGILAVKTRFALKFIDAAAPDVWDFNRSLAWAGKLNNQMKAMLQDKFKICCTNNNDFKNIYVHFVPHFSVYTGGAPGDSHFNIEVTYRIGSTVTVSGKDIECDWGAGADKGQQLIQRIIRYCFGKVSGTNDLTKTDFGPIVEWVKTQCGDNGFVMNDL